MVFTDIMSFLKAVREERICESCKLFGRENPQNYLDSDLYFCVCHLTSLSFAFLFLIEIEDIYDIYKYQI